MASCATACASNLRSTRGQSVISTGCEDETQGNPRGQGRDLAADTSEDDASVEEMARKKRRLSSEQVRSLEENFELERKVEPQKKAQLARDLGLHPRQVAVWFQNRRARYKTKQLQKDYDLLRFEYEALRSDFRALKQENEKLVAQLGHLKQKVQVENAGGGEDPADAWAIISTSLPSQTGAGPPTISGGARAGMLDTGHHHPLSRMLLLTEHNGSSTSLSSSCNGAVPIGPALLLKGGCLTSDSESSGTLNDLNEESPHSINNSLGFNLGRPSPSIKYAASNVINANGEDQCLIAPNVYQQFFSFDHTSVSDEACNSFGNVNDQCAAAVPLWDWTP